jgi:hypothetical protein
MEKECINIVPYMMLVIVWLTVIWLHTKCKKEGGECFGLIVFYFPLILVTLAALSKLTN